jgi:RsmE family RNA methyltransferase
MHNNLPRTRGTADEVSSAPRFFCPGDLSQGATRDLPDDAAHHASRVLRLTVGAPVIVFNGAGGESDAQISSIGKDHVAVRVGRWHDREAESPVRVTLVQGLSARERMDFTLQKAVELGVAEVFPVEMRRSVMRLADERAARRVEHWQNLVIAACEQCRRNRVPVVHSVSALPDWLGEHRTEPSTKSSCWRVRRAASQPRSSTWRRHAASRPSGSAPVFFAPRRLRWQRSLRFIRYGGISRLNQNPGKI